MLERGSAEVAGKRCGFFLQVIHGRAQRIRVPAVKEVSVHEAFRAPISLRETHVGEIGGVVKGFVMRGLRERASEVAEFGQEAAGMAAGAVGGLDRFRYGQSGKTAAEVSWQCFHEK